MKRFAALFMLLALFSCSLAALCQNDNFGTSEYKAFKEKLALEAKGETGDLMPLEFSGNIFLGKGANDFGPSPDPVWANHFGGTASDMANAVVTDNSGNIYITGTFSGKVTVNATEYNSVGTNDAFVAKLSNTGTIIWFTQISTTAGNTVSGNDIVIDATGNLYVTGHYTGVLTLGATQLPDINGFQFFYAKLNTSGSIVNGAYHSEDENERGIFIDVDNSGNVYATVTKSLSTDSRHESWILKYDSNANLLWAKSFDESFNSIIVYGENLFFSGVMNNYNDGYIDESLTLAMPISYNDIFIAKSDLNGNFIWGYVANHSTYGDSYQGYIDSDGNGNFYLTGFNRGSIDFSEHSLSDDGDFVGKFDVDGTFSWLYKISTSGTSKISVDGTGNCYVAKNLEVFMLNSMAEWQWSAPITKYAREIEVSSSGKIVEVGTINGLAYTSQFDNAGVEEWTAQFNGNSGTGRVEGLVTDNAGNIYTYGNTTAPANYFGQEIGVGTFICKQDANGNVVWLNHFPEVTVTTPSFGNPIILDKQNQNVYICGYFEESLVVNGTTTLTAATEGSTFVIKYDLNGNYINHLQEDIVGGGSLSVVTDYSGNLILCDTYSGTVNVANTSLTSVGSSDGYLAKYDTNLSPLWALSAGGEDVEYNIIASTDADDNIYITGEFYSQNVSVGSYPHPMNDGEGNVFLAKINASGEVQWAKSLAAAGSNSSDYSCWPTGIVSNDLGETYIKGWHGKSTFFDEIEITSPYNYNYFITKLDADGNVLWANSINEATYGFDYNQFAVDASGSVYLGAQAKGALTFSDSYTYTPSSGYDLFVAKYRTDGVLDWVKTIQSMGSYYSWISSVAVYNNEIYVGGYFDGYLNIDGQELQTNTRHGFVAKLQNQIYDVTFNVDMTGATQFIPGTDNVYLSGTMYNWAEPASTKASQPLSQVGETMIWSITLPLIEGGYSYKYFINEGSEGIEWLDGPKREIEVVEEIPSDDVWASAYPELFAGGSGTEDNPFLISNAEQLNNVRQFLDAYYLQTADIDLDLAPWNEGEGWEPIGNATIKFSGSYNGNYQIINNLYINRSSVNLQGLFGITSNAVIKNIKLLNVNVTGKNYIGAIAGQSNYSSIGNCLSTGTITGTTYVGGLVGFNQYGDINQCFSSSNVTGTNYIGGVTGVHQGDNLLLNSYSTGTLTGGDNVGGLVGTTAVNSLIENSYFAGSISGTSGLGGLVAYRFSVSAVKNSFWDTQTSGVATTEVGGEGKTTAEMKDIFTYTSAGWDFKGLGAEGIWNIDPDGYPYLNWIYPENTSSQVPVLANVVADDVTNVSGTGATVNATITCIGNPEFTQHGVCWNTTGEPTTADSKTTLGTISELMFGSDITGLTPNTVYYVRAYAENTQGTAYSNELTFVTVVAPTGDGSPETPYQISSLAELYWLATTPSVWGMNFIQTNDIDASQTANWNNGQGFQPIGNIENPFMGIYNGNGFLISNVTINQPDNDYVGVFGKIQDAILYQVGVANANIVGSSYVGALAGGVSFSIVEQCFTSGSVEGKGGNDGGLFGVTEQGEVRSCYSTCSVTGYVGSPGQGGLIGLVNETSIRGCYSMGLVTSPYANGLIGNINGGEVENCYWDTETSGCLSSVAGTGKTTTEMKDISTFLNGGWDFKGLGTEGVWNIGNERNDGYPYLNWQYPEDPAISMEILPSAVITNVTNITQNSASFQIEVTNIGNPQGISFGVCWSSTNPEPTVEDFSRVSEENFALGSFIEDVFEFTHSTVYYARAFASSTNGTAYSDVVTFNTECGAHSLPLTENFDNSYEFPNCWNAFTVGDGSVLIYNFEPTSNPNHAWLFAQVVGAEAYLVLPELDADINTLNLQFMSKSGATGYGWPSDMVLEIGTMTDPTNASTFSYFTHIQTQDIYEQQNISLATFGGTDRYIAFRVSSNIQEQAGYVFIDDVNIVSNISSSLVTFNVDMTNASGFNPAEDVVYITGSMFGWAEPGANPDNQTMTRVEESMIWTKTIEVAQGNYEYKYFLNAGWENGEW
ncbi:MAG TPA: SBBP repeat-containing protein, partial [Tenuifilaceae bacterium]|nr:SBBP repeat-containing protein [Tenuifilaceae bacterium]